VVAASTVLRALARSPWIWTDRLLVRTIALVGGALGSL